MIASGIIYISVPDMDILAQLFLMKDPLTAEKRFFHADDVRRACR